MHATQHDRFSKTLSVFSTFVFAGSLLFATFAVGTAQAQTPDTETPAAEDVCDGLDRRLYGLCNAYCEAKDCDLDSRLLQHRSCSRLLYGYARRSDGALPPCIDEDGDGCHDELDGCPGIDDMDSCNVDSDGDGTDDACDGCPGNPAKVAPGVCGCGVADADSDGDGTPDCNDGCPADPAKVAPGVCGCGVADTDTDGDGTADCVDDCPDDPNKTEPGGCGCSGSPVVCPVTDPCRPDICVEGQGCQPGGFVVCDDGDRCTSDSCVPGIGCRFTPINPCPDE